MYLPYAKERGGAGLEIRPPFPQIFWRTRVRGGWVGDDLCDVQEGGEREASRLLLRPASVRRRRRRRRRSRLGKWGRRKRRKGVSCVRAPYYWMGRDSPLCCLINTIWL